MLEKLESIGASAQALVGHLKDSYLEEAKGYDRDRLIEDAQSKRLAWRIAGASMLIAALAVVGYPIVLAILLPLKTVEHVPIIVNQDTGELRVSQGLSGTPKSLEPLLVETAAFAYVFNREGYLQATVKSQYGKIRSMTEPEDVPRLDREWNVKNPESPWQKYGRRQVEIVRRSVRFQPDHVVVVEYAKKVDPGLPSETVTWHAATMKYRLTMVPPASENDRYHNPMGLYFGQFRVSGITELTQ